MLKQEDLLYSMTELSSEDILETGRRLGYLRRRRGGLRKTVRLLLVAAILVSLLSVTAYAAGWFGLRQRVSRTEDSAESGEESCVESGETSVPDKGETGILSDNAYGSEPAGQAHAAWTAYMAEHRESYTELSGNDAENWHPDDPELQKLQTIYGAFDREALEKLLEIRDEYGVALHTDLVVPPTPELFLRVTGLSPFLRGGNRMSDFGAGYVYEDGSFHYEGGHVTLADGSRAEFVADCGRRGVLDPAYTPVVHMEDYTEWEYVNVGGDRLILSVAKGQGSSFLFYESEDCLITLRSSCEDAEALADCFDFAAMSRLQPDLSALRSDPDAAEAGEGLLTLERFLQSEEYRASSAFQKLYNDYELPIDSAKLAGLGASRPEGFSQLYYYGSFPTGIAEVDGGLAEILAAQPLRAAGLADIYWFGLPFHEGGISPDGGMYNEAYKAATAEGRLEEEACLARFGMGAFLRDATLDSFILWENGGRYAEFRVGNLAGQLHYLPKGCFYPLFHPVMGRQGESWAYDAACGEQVNICVMAGAVYPDWDCGYILYETDTAYVVVVGPTETYALQLLADAVDFSCFR